jgi:hypothetical protein
MRKEASTKQAGKIRTDDTAIAPAEPSQLGDLEVVNKGLV